MFNHQANAKYAFYYLLSLAALIFLSFSVGMIIFGIIDKSIADALSNNHSYNYDGQLKFAISALFISAPIFYVAMNLINKGLHKGELEKNSGVRRWLSYFILLISSLIILGVFVGIINTFLSGELTSRFLLKAVTVFVIAGGVFSYFLYDIKRENPEKKNLAVRLFFFISLVLVVAVFISSWFFVESPKTARARRLDGIVVNNIYTLENAVNSYFSRNDRLPNSLAELRADSGDFYLNDDNLVDPETKAPIVYEKIGNLDFRFCADFRTDSQDNKNNTGAPMSYPVNDKSHRAGSQCLKGVLFDQEKVKEIQGKKGSIPATEAKH